MPDDDEFPFYLLLDLTHEQRKSVIDAEDEYWDTNPWESNYESVHVNSCPLETCPLCYHILANNS